MTIVDVEQLLHVPETTIQRWIREGNLPCTEHKGKYFFDRETLLSWARSKQIHVDQTVRKSGRVKNLKVSSCDDLLNAMRRGGLLQLKEQHSKTSLIRNACNYLPFPVDVRERVIDQITQREALSSTGLGNGIAIPHPRIPMKLELEESLIVSIFLEKPLDYGAQDEIPVFFFFLTCQVKSFRWSELSGKSHFLRLSQIRSSTRAVGVVTCPNPTPRTRVASAIFMKQRKELKRNFLKSIDGFKISKFGFFPLLYNNLSGCGLPLLGDIEQIFD